MQITRRIKYNFYLIWLFMYTVILDGWMIDLKRRIMHIECYRDPECISINVCAYVYFYVRWLLKS